MHTSDTTQRIGDLAWAVANDGPAAHESALQALAIQAARWDVAPGAAAALADRAAPDVVRQRAFAAVSDALRIAERRSGERPLAQVA